MRCGIWCCRNTAVSLPESCYIIVCRNRKPDILPSGVVLDFDLACKRSLGPLRRFEFVAPAAHPTGFSIGFMMASPENSFVRSLVDNLAAYNRSWFFLPYVTVMFSTGCHYAS